MRIEAPGLEESLRTELQSWLCCALADVLALPPETSFFTGDRASIAEAVAHTHHTIDAVRVYVSECREVARSQVLAPSILAFADLAEAICRLLEEEVTIVQDRYVTFAR